MNTSARPRCFSLALRLRCIPLLVAALALLAAALPARTQVPLHEQDREWVNIAPDSLRESGFDMVSVGYTEGQRVIYVTNDYRVPNSGGQYVRRLLKSTDEGDTWTTIYNRSTAERNGWTYWAMQYVSPWVQDADILYGFTQKQVYKSTDGGETWQDLTPQVKQADLGEEHAEVLGLAPTDVAVSPFDSAKVFVSSANANAYALASSDGGRTWRGTKWYGGSHGADAGLALSHADSSRAYVWAFLRGTISHSAFERTDDWGRTFEVMSVRRRRPSYTDEVGNLYAGSQISRDGGQTWQQMDYGAAVVASEGALAVSYDHVSYDRGRTWHQMPADPPPASRIVEIDERDSTLFAISGSGVWAYAREGAFATPVEEPSARPEALQVSSYPNPFRERATIRYELPRAGKVRVAVYDVLGRRVRTLVDGQRASGRHRAHFEASGLSAGVYLIRARLETSSEARTVTRKVTVAR